MSGRLFLELIAASGARYVEELKKECYLAGRVPAARRDFGASGRVRRCGSRLRDCGFILTGTLALFETHE